MLVYSAPYDPTFQSTLPARGATQQPFVAEIVPLISIHAPRTGSDQWRYDGKCSCCKFQSTLPARGATQCGAGLLGKRRFQSTLPARGATEAWGVMMEEIEISIHAPRTGSDPAPASWTASPPFQSTLPARGATLDNQHNFTYTDCISIHAPRTGSDGASGVHHREAGISIHAPRTGSDLCTSASMRWQTVFQSTLPARGATLL